MRDMLGISLRCAILTALRKPATIYSIAILRASILLRSNPMAAANADNMVVNKKPRSRESLMSEASCMT